MTVDPIVGDAGKEIPPASLVAPSAEAVMARAAGENFPVASRLLPRAQREHLLAVYGFARLVDELGDDVARSPAERLAALDWLEGELEAALAGSARHPLMARLSRTVSDCGLGREPFARLIEANRTDQRRDRYGTWEELRAYCALSADPVGEIVLGIFGHAEPELISLSDDICTALQLAEHCQDVGEDLTRGRIYLPREDLERFGCREQDLHEPHASSELRGVLAFEVERGRGLMRAGLPLLARLRGRPRLAVAAFAAGGRAAFDAIERAGFDVLPGPPRASTARRLSALLATLAAPAARSK
ncbi:MAG TPA: squalene synthase HpnC [Solirubrobacteraceae bacterium]|jgi:squalene synthase HpnC|nr:squalene synthase HpnC [Solirubrobacteraceae bacterium]